MIRSRRCLDAPGLGARHEVVAWIDEHARAHVMQTTGLTCDDRLYQLAFGRADLGDRALLTLVLQGRLFLASEGRCDIVEAGQSIYLPRKGELSARTEGEHYQSLVLEWDCGSGHAAAVVPFALDAVRSIAAAILRAPAPQSETVAELERLVPALVPGADLHFARVSVAEARELRAQEVADALDAVLSSLDEQPMATDLERRLGVTGRQVTRMVDAFRARYGYGATNWLEMRSRRRLLLAATLLTAPGASVAAVAQVVGYHRPETLARAFAVAGLPKPSLVRQQVQELRAGWTADADRYLEARPGLGPDIAGHPGAVRTAEA